MSVTVAIKHPSPLIPPGVQGKTCAMDKLVAFNLIKPTWKIAHSLENKSYHWQL